MRPSARAWAITSAGQAGARAAAVMTARMPPGRRSRWHAAYTMPGPEPSSLSLVLAPGWGQPGNGQVEALAARLLRLLPHPFTAADTAGWVPLRAVGPAGRVLPDPEGFQNLVIASELRRYGWAGEHHAAR